MSYSEVGSGDTAEFFKSAEIVWSTSNKISSLLEPGSLIFSGCQEMESEMRMPFVEVTYTRKQRKCCNEGPR